jgi:hypothetical protein
MFFFGLAFREFCRFVVLGSEYPVNTGFISETPIRTHLGIRRELNEPLLCRFLSHGLTVSQLDQLMQTASRMILLQDFTPHRSLYFYSFDCFCSSFLFSRNSGSSVLLIATLVVKNFFQRSPHRMKANPTTIEKKDRQCKG